MPPQNKDNFFKLVSLIVDVAFTVIHKYIKERILGQDNFETFLNKEKHTLVHLFETSPCCNCIFGNIKGQKLISRKQLLLLYILDETKQKQSHKKFEGSKLSQICICKYSAKTNIEVKDADIILAAFIIEKCRKHEMVVDHWIHQIKDLRNEVFHLTNIQEITDETFNRKWNKLERCILGIATFINNAYAEETEKKILQTKKLAIIFDYNLKYEILCRDYWKQKCADFERVRMQEFEEKAAAVHLKFPEFFGRLMKENCKRAIERIHSLENMIDQIHIMINSFGNLEHAEMFEATDLLGDEKRIHIPVFVHLYVPTSMDKISVFGAIDEMKLINTLGTNIRIQAIQNDYHKMFAAIAFRLISNVHELCSGIDKIWNCELTDVSVITPLHSDNFDIHVPSREDMEPQDKNNYFRLVALVADVACIVIQKYIKENILGSDSLETFLNKKKHTLVHMHETSRCCECVAEKIHGERLIPRKQLLSLYHLDKSRQVPQHQTYSRGRLTQICICKYSANCYVNIEDIDIVLANWIIQKCGKHNLGVDNWIVQIFDVRNEIFHLSDMQEISETKYQRCWTKLEGSIMGIAMSVNSAYAEETLKQILYTKKLTKISDYMLKSEIRHRDYWKNKCAELERAYLLEIEEKAYDQHYYLPEISNDSTETECRRIFEKIQTLETMVDKINILINRCGNDENKDILVVTELKDDGMQEINIPMMLQLDLPTSWDKQKVSEHIDEIILKESKHSNIRIKAVSTCSRDDLNIFAEITNEYMRNIYKLRSEISTRMSGLLLDASVITTEHTNNDFNSEIQDESVQQTSIASCNTIPSDCMEKENFYKATLLEDILCSSLTDVIKVELVRTYVSFEDFINLHQHEIYHMCYRHKCCHCISSSQQLPPQLLDDLHLRLIFDVHDRRSFHNKDVSGYCCCKAKKKISITAIDSYFACVLLLYFCNSVFWHSCLDLQSVSFDNLLNKNKHAIFHLWQSNIQCCQCNAVYMNNRHKSKISQDDWKLLFKQKTQPCLLHKKIKDYEESICCRDASNDIQIGDLGCELQNILLDNICPLKYEIRTVMNILVDFYAASSTGIISRGAYKDLYVKLSIIIKNIAYTISNEITYNEKLLKLSDCVYDETMYTSRLLIFQNKCEMLQHLNLNRSDELDMRITENIQDENEKDKQSLHGGELQCSVESIPSIEEGIFHRISRFSYMLCKEHGQDVVTFCKSHELPLCDVCLTVHAKCTICELEIAAKNNNSSVKFSILEKQIKTFSRCINTFIPELDCEILLISNMQECFRKSIDDTKKELTLVIDNIKEEGLRNIEGYASKMKSFHNHMSDELDMRIIEKNQAGNKNNKQSLHGGELQCSVESIPSIKEGIFHRISRFSYMQCKEHGQDVVRFCKSHELPLCDVCLTVFAKCTISELEIAAKNNKSSLKFCIIEKQIETFSRCINTFPPELEKRILMISNMQECFLKSIDDSKKELTLVIYEIKEEGLRHIEGYASKMKYFHNHMSVLQLSLEDKVKEICMCLSHASDIETLLILPGIEDDLQRYQNRLLKILQDKCIDIINPIVNLKTLGEQTFQICYDTRERRFEKLFLIQEPLSVNSIIKIKDMQFKESLAFEIPNGNDVNKITGCTILLNGVMCFVDAQCNRCILRSTDGVYQSITLPSIPLDITAISNSTVAILHRTSIAVFNTQEKAINEFKFKVSGKFRLITFHKQTLIVCVSGCSFFIINLQGKKIKEIHIEENMISCISCWNNKIIYANRDKNDIYAVDLHTGKSTLLNHIGGIANSPTCIASDGSGKLFVIGSHNNNIVVISVYGKVHKELVRGFKNIKYPKATAYDATQRRLLICSPIGDAAVYSLRD